MKCSSVRTAAVSVVLLMLVFLVSTGETFSPSSQSYPSIKPEASRYSKIINVLKSSSLNEDGDFCIQGINDEKTIIDKGDGNEEFTSLLDMEYNQVKDSKLSDILKPPSPTSSADDDVRLETLQLEGDYDSSMKSSEEFSSLLDPFPLGKSAVSQVGLRVLGTATPPCASNVDKSSATSMTPTQSSDLMPLAASLSKFAGADGNEEAAEVEALEAFLGSIFEVAPSDIRRYAIEMAAIGFDPDCESSKELEFEDLVFMKKLHRRFFWKEWEKLL